MFTFGVKPLSSVVQSIRLAARADGSAQDLRRAMNGTDGELHISIVRGWGHATSSAGTMAQFNRECCVPSSRPAPRCPRRAAPRRSGPPRVHWR